MIMETYPLVNNQRSNYPFAFEVDVAFVRPRTIARLLRQINDVTDERERERERERESHLSDRAKY